jgi:hypothetical protein
VILAAVVSLAAAAIALVFRLAEPFDHGVWLVAYLFLVGFLAQVLLAWGQTELRDSFPVRTSRGASTSQIVFWNAGVIAVPLGVLAGTRIAVVLGSLSLLVALASLSSAVRPRLASASGDRRWLTQGYVGLLAFMAGSVVVGTALAWDIAWV